MCHGDYVQNDLAKTPGSYWSQEMTCEVKIQTFWGHPGSIMGVFVY